ncbi:MAG: biopolymer transporter ExbD [Cyclobacteriaceae bacterium]
MKFQKKINRGVEISTASLPDIVFLLLFFFMVSATIRPKEEPLAVKYPHAAAITKVDKKELIREISVGIPKKALFGTEPQISVDNKMIDISAIAQWAIEQRESLPEYYKNQMIILLKSDEKVHMGLISDIQEELKKANARKIVFRTNQE